MRFSQRAPTGNYYLVLLDIVNNVVFDWNDSTWKALGSATTPSVAMTAQTIGLWKNYHADVNLVTACPDMTRRSVKVIMFQRAGGSPAPATDAVVSDKSLVICGGYEVPPQEDENSLKVVVTSTLRTAEGDSAHFSVCLQHQGQIIPLHTLAVGATCAINVTRDPDTTGGSRVNQLDLSTSDIGATNAAHFFEATYANPNYTAKRGYLVTATVVAGGVTYVGRIRFMTF